MAIFGLFWPILPNNFSKTAPKRLKITSRTISHMLSSFLAVLSREKYQKVVKNGPKNSNFRQNGLF